MALRHARTAAFCVPRHQRDVSAELSHVMIEGWGVRSGRKPRSKMLDVQGLTACAPMHYMLNRGSSSRHAITTSDDCRSRETRRSLRAAESAPLHSDHAGLRRDRTL